jgi:hypothetical protein
MASVRLVLLGLLTSGALYAQDGSASLADLQQAAEGRAQEWNALASNLEQRLARLLPCDPRVRGSIEEVDRASGARIAALNIYWKAVAARSKQQLEAIRAMLGKEDARAANWAKDFAELTLDAGSAQAQAATLGPFLKSHPSLAEAQKDSGEIAALYQAAAARAQSRQTSTAPRVSDLRELLKRAEARQAAIETLISDLGTEDSLWTAYYAARIARAQVECAITGGAAAPVQPARPLRPTAGKKQ